MFDIPRRHKSYVVAESGHISSVGTIGVIQFHWQLPVPVRLWHPTLAPFGTRDTDTDPYRFGVRIEGNQMIVRERNGRQHHSIVLGELVEVLETPCTVTADGYLVPDCYATLAPEFYRGLLASLREAAAGNRGAILEHDNTPVVQVSKAYAGMKFLQLSWSAVDGKPEAAAYDAAADFVPCEVTYPVAYAAWKLAQQY